MRAVPSLLMLLLLSSPARADDDGIDVTVDDDGTVRGTVDVHATEARARALVGDAIRIRKLSPDITEVTSKQEGDCAVVRSVAEGLATVDYTVRRCPTTAGFVETLIASDQIDDYYGEWLIAPRGATTSLTFRLRLSVTLPVPDRLVRGSVKRSVRNILDSVRQELSR